MPALSIKAETAVIALAETLRALRLQHGESQALAAQRIGVGLRTYQRMESTGPAAGQVGIPAGGVAIGDFLMALEVYGVDVVAALTQLHQAAPAPVGAHRERGRTPTPRGDTTRQI
ncbi:helix-turn-helix transcriptional regulator [Variovorax ginsengisoli]|uniref:Helix-turn-helix transcriptional regulator n=1 Tax=Variovorax ginsengisoli TaxID=363844 RepID=A0ABT8SBP3_9BURK|nr:helix-turn-helix transcriptional regulator [Variovorax ginsengisoli]MDN8617166.1 helix-turn-helix transcriptional regulator [Variovorax ginsengisoli]MDO1536336.1 helix-turn-helix transcriptional regulator [Variovorax ginsengisoli]